MVEKTSGIISDLIFDMSAPRFSQFLCNQDDYRHAASCTGLDKTYFIHKSSKSRVVTAKIFEIFIS